MVMGMTTVYARYEKKDLWIKVQGIVLDEATETLISYKDEMHMCLSPSTYLHKVISNNKAMYSSKVQFHV